MNVYFYNFIFLTFFLFACESELFPRKLFKYITFIYFIIVFGCRWTAGVDFYGYLKYYVTNFKTEPGYLILQEIFRNYNLYFGNLIFIIYFFTTISSLLFINKLFTSNYCIYIFFISEFHIMSINPIRTYIAINFFLIGLYLLCFSTKKFRAILCIMLGFLFHKLILFAVIFIPFFKFKLKTNKNLKIIMWLMLFILPCIPIYNLLYYIVKNIGIYDHYFGSIYDVNLSILNIIRYYIVLIFYCFFNIKINDDSEKYYFINVGMSIYIIIMGCAIGFAPLHRVGLFFKIFEILYFFYLFTKTNKGIKLFILLFFIVNYGFIAYKDMGYLKYYEYKPLQYKNEKNYDQYYEEIQENNWKFELGR